MSKTKKYNLQVPICKDTEAKLRQLADEMGLGLTQYCRWVLMQHTKGVSVQATTVVEQTTVKEVAQSFSVEKTEKTKTDKPKIKKGLGSK